MAKPFLPVALATMVGVSLFGCVSWIRTFSADVVSIEYTQHHLSHYDELPRTTSVGPSDTIQQQQQMFECSSMEDDLMRLLQESDQVFLLAPPKGGGSTLKEFTKECMGDTNPDEPHHVDNWINIAEGRHQFFFNTIQPPRLVASHIVHPEPSIIMRDLINTSARRSLLIYSYRDETDRLKSAIKYIVRAKLCDSDDITFERFNNLVGLKLTHDECSFDEEAFVDNVLRARYEEIGSSIYDEFNCEIWDEIDQTAPRLFLVHHKQLEKLQLQLSKHFCPEVQPKALNVISAIAEVDKRSYLVRSSTAKKAVPLEEWVEAKSSTMEFLMQLSTGTCKGRTNQVGDFLDSCPERFIRVHPKGEP